MRLTTRLCAQHLGWTFKKHWQVQGTRVPRDTGAASELQKFGLVVKDPIDVLSPKRALERYEMVGCKPQEYVEDSTHPDWHNQACHIYGNSNVLLEGIPQAQLLTKTVEINGLPRNIEETLLRMEISSSVERSVQNSIMASSVFDAEQVKLPKVKLPQRPAYNLPRFYGISQARKNRLLFNKLIFECEKLSGRSVSAHRRLVDNADFSVTLPKEADLLQFAISVEKMIVSTKPLEPVKSKYDAQLPDLYPIKSTITIPKRNIYRKETVFPFTTVSAAYHPHTIILDFNRELVGNVHGSSVSTTQFQSRTMLKAFAVAVARAKEIYGDSAYEKILKPVVIQSIQTDGQTFHFGVFQLNTLNLDGLDGVKNYWFHQANLDLFTECGYKDGKPVLEGYNKDVFRCLNAFYNNH